MKVLFISPHFPPTNAADMQRVRLLLPHLAAAGVEAEVLAVEPGQVAAPRDAWLAAGLPPEIPVHRVKALSLGWAKVPGLGILSYRALGALRRKGNELFGRGQGSGGREQEAGYECSGPAPDSRHLIPDPSRRFDLIYFSTTQFGVHLLGPEWKRRFGVPFVMDYQDPWVSDYYRDHPDVVPPGGRLKYGIASWLARRQEPRVLRECAGITSVSAAYPAQLQRRYPWLVVEEVEGQSEVRGRRSEVGGQKAEVGFPTSDLRSPTSDLRLLRSTVLPFPGDARDVERVKAEGVRQAVFDPADGKRHWVYVGRGGRDMALAARALFSAVRSEVRGQKSEARGQKSEVSRNPTSDLRPPTSDLRLHFVGTSYAAAGKGVKTIEPLAAEYGLQDIVFEYPDRIPYSETLRCLLDAEALIVPGSDDPGYTASKIYPYLLSGKPLLAIFHEQSSVVSLLREAGGGTAIGFGGGDGVEEIAARVAAVISEAGGRIPAVPLDEAAFAPHTARVQAMRLVEFFRQCLK